jgi:hypothetical protein
VTPRTCTRRSPPVSPRTRRLRPEPGRLRLAGRGHEPSRPANLLSEIYEVAGNGPRGSAEPVLVAVHFHYHRPVPRDATTDCRVISIQDRETAQAATVRSPRSRCDAAVEVRVPGRPRRAGWRRNAEVEPWVQGGSRRAGWFRNAEVESRMHSISRGAFLSHQRHARHRKLRVMRRERHGLGACRDQRCRQRSASKRKIGPKHPLLPPNGDNTAVANK